MNVYIHNLNVKHVCVCGGGGGGRERGEWGGASSRLYDKVFFDLICMEDGHYAVQATKV